MNLVEVTPEAKAELAKTAPSEVATATLQDRVEMALPPALPNTLSALGRPSVEQIAEARLARWSRPPSKPTTRL